MNAASDPPANAGGRAVRLVLLLLRCYKLLVSPYFRGSCRFLPSCADYAAAAVAERGVLVGGWLALRRLARCHPFAQAGHDPVPHAMSGRAGTRP